MKEFIQKIKSYAPLIGTLISADSYRRSVSSDKVSKRYEAAAESLEQTNQKLDNLYSELINKKQNVNVLDGKEIAIQGRIDELLEEFRNAANRIKQYREEATESQTNQSMIETIQVEAEKIVERLSCEVEELADTKARKSIEFEDILKTITDNTDINQLLGDSVEKFNSILSNLSTAQLGALTHILFGITIYYLTMNIATAFYGDKLIIYFKLEEKYPRLARWIKYRRIYQNYNVASNLILILGITGYIVFVNISVFKDI